MSLSSILEGHDVVIASETGSGKTIAYLAPIIAKILKDKQSAYEEGEEEGLETIEYLYNK